MLRVIKFSLVFVFLFYADLAKTQSYIKIDSLKLLLKKNNADSTISKIYFSLFNSYYTLNSYDTAMTFALLMKDHTQKTKDKKWMPDAYNCIGTIYVEQGNYAAAYDKFFQMMQLAAEAGDKAKTSKALNNIGVIYDYQGMYKEAVEYYFKGLKIKEELDDKHGMASSYNNIGLIYWNQKNYDQALNYCFLALKLFTEVDSKKKIGLALNNIGNIYFEKGDSTNAMKFYQRSLTLREEINDKQGIAMSLNNIGNLYKDGGKYNFALAYYNRSLALRQELGDNSGIASTTGNIGVTYTAQANFVQAEQYLKKALQMSIDMSESEGILSWYEALYDLYKRMGKYDVAINYLEIFAKVKDSLDMQEARQETDKLEMRYEFDKEKIAIQKEQEKQNEIAKNEKQQLRIISYIVGGSLLIVMYFAFSLYKRNKITSRQKNIIEEQKKLVDEKNKDILDSINYAQRIQSAILPEVNEIERLFDDSFVLFKPKDIVSGDFYWLTFINNHYYFAAADCTGHGVPGGFMSMLGISLLNEIVNEKKITDPTDILDMMRLKLILSLKQKGEMGENKDGMDMTLCRMNEEKTELTYAAANNPLWIIRGGELMQFAADKQPVGISSTNAKQFAQQTIKLQKGDSVYLFTDGYADQFGGHSGKKLKYKKLKEILLSVSSQPMQLQKNELENQFEHWRGKLEQVDDVCIIGIKV
jgi:serine phosphatase RsbU (regulator of sigma subunit)/Tfp pilus assembly protein PilF